MRKNFVFIVSSPEGGVEGAFGKASKAVRWAENQHDFKAPRGSIKKIQEGGETILHDLGWDDIEEQIVAIERLPVR